jgi:hypothetical protein
MMRCPSCGVARFLFYVHLPAASHAAGGWRAMSRFSLRSDGFDERTLRLRSTCLRIHRSRRRRRRGALRQRSVPTKANQLSDEAGHADVLRTRALACGDGLRNASASWSNPRTALEAHDCTVAGARRHIPTTGFVRRPLHPYRHLRVDAVTRLVELGAKAIKPDAIQRGVQHVDAHIGKGLQTR